MIVFSKIKEFEGISEENLINGSISYLSTHFKMPPYFGTGHGRFISKPKDWLAVRDNFMYKLELTNITPNNEIKPSFQIKKNSELIKCLGIQLVPQLRETGVYEVPWKTNPDLVNFQDFSQYLGVSSTLNLCNRILNSEDITPILNPFEEKISKEYLSFMLQKYLILRREKKLITPSIPILKVGAYLYGKSLFDELKKIMETEFKEGKFRAQKSLENSLLELIQ